MGLVARALELRGIATTLTSWNAGVTRLTMPPRATFTRLARGATLGRPGDAAQQRRVLELGNRIHPGLTDEDLRNPHDFPDLFGDPDWQFEDGQLAGLVSARVALKARLEGDRAVGPG